MAFLVSRVASSLATAMRQHAPRLLVSTQYRPFAAAAASADKGKSPFMQFFPEGSIYDNLDVGRSWRASDLRVKSFEDLQKLWFVLLKERNILLTLEHECQRTKREMPRADRLRKVRKSMAAIKVVIGERDNALLEAELKDPETIQEARKVLGIKYDEVEEKPFNEWESKNLLNVDYPTRVVKPGQPRRPLKSAERTAFRSDLAVERKRAERAAKAVIREEVSKMSDEDLLAKVKEVRVAVDQGAIYPDIDVRSRLVMHEAETRGLDRGLRRV